MLLKLGSLKIGWCVGDIGRHDIFWKEGDFTKMVKPFWLLFFSRLTLSLFLLN